jgi:hypothetical protein
MEYPDAKNYQVTDPCIVLEHDMLSFGTRRLCDVRAKAWSLASQQKHPFFAAERRQDMTLRSSRIMQTYAVLLSQFLYTMTRQILWLTV